jgi:hypothetical protein
MGDMAHLRQVFHDARHYSKVWTAWKPGMPAPRSDAALEALQPVLRGDLPLCFNADTDREILRALALADEFGLKVEIAGGERGLEADGTLKTHGAPVSSR